MSYPRTTDTDADTGHMLKEPQKLLTSAAPSEGTGGQRGQGGFSLCLFAALLTFVSHTGICPNKKWAAFFSLSAVHPRPLRRPQRENGQALALAWGSAPPQFHGTSFSLRKL